MSTEGSSAADRGSGLSAGLGDAVAPDMEMVQRGPNAGPHIQWNHIDGPLLCCRDGTLHWLTMAERLWMRLGLTTLEQLDSKHNHEPQRP
jgi:hypothetical protein